ncbi:hypothetical protein ACIBCP_23420 [Streptomyces sp. NPDC051287]|uniref:hypothetical protein n=1 Tax=Streptomyces sp. NPDC051287 TaxID=3365648 RepID=UPI003799BC73
MGTEILYRQAANKGDTEALRRLAHLRIEAGDRESAEALYRKAADKGDTEAVHRLACLREAEGDWEGAEILYRQAADVGDVYSELEEAFKERWPYGLDPDGTPTSPWQ